MKTIRILCLLMISVMLISATACQKQVEKPSVTPDVPNTSEAPVVNENSDVPAAFLEPMKKLLSEWGIRKGSLSDPLIGSRILMYEKTKDEVGYAILDIDDNGVDDMIVAPFDGFAENGLVYDILTIKDNKAYHLANSLQATYHFMDDGSFILRTPKEDKTFTFKLVTIDGDKRPIEVEITKEEAAKYYVSTVELTPFSELEK